MKKWILILLLVGIGPLDQPLHADQADRPVVALQERDYRHDPLWIFAGSLRVFAAVLKDFDQLGANASQKQKADALDSVRGATLGISDDQKNFLEFYSKTKFPPKAVPFIKPVAAFVQSDQFQKEEKLLPQNIKDADISQLRSVYLFYSKIPFPSQRQFDQYIAEAYYGGIPPDIRF